MMGRTPLPGRLNHSDSAQFGDLSRAAGYQIATGQSWIAPQAFSLRSGCAVVHEGNWSRSGSRLHGVSWCAARLLRFAAGPSLRT